MLVERIETVNGIDDIKLIGETELERQFIKQLAESGTLSCLNKQVGDTVLFRPISVMSDISSLTSSKNSIGKFDFSVRQNENYNVDLTFNSVLDNTPINLTQFEAIRLQIKYSKSAAPLISLAIGSGLVISGTDSNILLVSLTNEQTASLSCRPYYYDVLMEKPTSKVYYLEGKITVKPTTTR